MIYLNLILLIVLLVVVYSFGRPALKGWPYAPSTKPLISRMIDLAELKPGCKCLDIGSGDGRIVLSLAQKGFQAEGIEMNPLLAWYSKQKLKRVNFLDKTRIIKANFKKVDLSSYDAVFVFGSLFIMKDIEEKLQKDLKPGAVVISNGSEFPGWKYFKKEGTIYIYKK